MNITFYFLIGFYLFVAGIFLLHCPNKLLDYLMIIFWPIISVIGFICLLGYISYIGFKRLQYKIVYSYYYLLDKRVKKYQTWMDVKKDDNK